MSKIFVSYKYSDPNVEQIPVHIVEDLGYTSPRSYVDIIDENLSALGHICKAEKSGESLEGLSDDQIAEKLSDRIYDSTVTIVLLSKGMDNGSNQKNQWIPWEVSYSLTENNRGGRVSATNAMIAVVLPDENGSYDYFVEQKPCLCTIWKNESIFPVIGLHMFNRCNPKIGSCPFSICDSKDVHTGEDHSYIQPVRWKSFINEPDYYIKLALERLKNKDDYNVNPRKFFEI